MVGLTLAYGRHMCEWQSSFNRRKKRKSKAPKRAMLITNGDLMDKTKGKCRREAHKLKRRVKDENKRLTCERVC